MKQKFDETVTCLNDGGDSDGAGKVRPLSYQGGGGGNKERKNTGRRYTQHFLCSGEEIKENKINE